MTDEVNFGAAINLIIAVLTLAVPSLAALYFRSKAKVSKLREFIDTVDDALQDDSVSEDEYRSIFNKGKELIS